MSAIPAIMQAIDEVWPNVDALAGVQCSLGWPPEGLEIEAVWQMGPDPTDTAWVMLGNAKRDDYVSFAISLQVRVPGHDNLTSLVRADEILDGVYEGVAMCSNFGGLTTNVPLPVLANWRGPFPGPEGAVTQVDINLRCRLRS